MNQLPDRGNHPPAPLQQLLATVARLRAPDGCPWDRQQTAASMAPHLLEEAFEAADALRQDDAASIQEELGDVLVNVAMICQIRREAGGPGLDEVAATAAAKLVRRHPHVFAAERASSAAAAYAGWEQQKQREKLASDGDRSVLAGLPKALPALLRAFRCGEKAARAGFDWPDQHGPRQKVEEELQELTAAIASGDQQAMADELGDVLFSLCNLARHLGINPELALAGTVDKFQRRFRAVEQQLDHQLQGRSLTEMDAAWERAKAAERTATPPTADRQPGDG